MEQIAAVGAIALRWDKCLISRLERFSRRSVISGYTVTLAAVPFYVCLELRPVAEVDDDVTEPVAEPILQTFHLGLEDGRTSLRVES